MPENTPESPTPVERFFTPARRRYAYGVVASCAPLLVAVGVLTEGVASLVVNVAAAVLAVGGSTLAMRNISEE